MDDKTIETYNKSAQVYDDETIDFWEKFPRTFLDEFAKNVEGDSKVLDVGSGPGRDGLLLKEAGLTVTCLDASESMIALSRARGLESIVGDLLDLPFENESFDGVWAYTSLLHIPKASMPKALAEIKRVLKPQGIFALGLIEGDFEGFKESSGVSLPRFFAYYEKEEVEALLVQAGFLITHLETFKPNTKNYLNFLSKSSS